MGWGLFVVWDGEHRSMAVTLRVGIVPLGQPLALAPVHQNGVSRPRFGMYFLQYGYVVSRRTRELEERP